MNAPNVDFMRYFMYSPSLRSFMTEHPNEMSLYLWLLSFQYDRNTPVPSKLDKILAEELDNGNIVSIVTQLDLSTYTGLSLPTIKRYYKFLSDAGLIRVRNTGVVRLGKRIDEGVLRGDVYGWGIFAREFDYNSREELRVKREKGVEATIPPNNQLNIHQINQETQKPVTVPPAYVEGYTEEMKKPKSKELPPSKWGQNEFVRHFCATYKAKTGSSYPVTGKDLGLMKNIVSNYTAKAKLKRVMEVYINHAQQYNDIIDYYRGQEATVAGFNASLKRIWAGDLRLETPGLVLSKAEEKAQALEKGRTNYAPRHDEVVAAEANLLETYGDVMSLKEMDDIQSTVGHKWNEGPDAALAYIASMMEYYKTIAEGKNERNKRTA